MTLNSSSTILPRLPPKLTSWRTLLGELERVVRGERTTVDPRALLFVAAEVILEGRKADERGLQRIHRANVPSSNVIAFPRR
jgi:hypothetical protein